MTDKYFEVALVLTIPAPSYDEALNKATEVVEGIQMDAGLGVMMVDYYEHDNEGHRVVYLSSEEGVGDDALPFDEEDQALAASSTTEIFDTGEDLPSITALTDTVAAPQSLLRTLPPAQLAKALEFVGDEVSGEVPTVLDDAQARANIEAAFDTAEDGGTFTSDVEDETPINLGQQKLMEQPISSILDGWVVQGKGGKQSLLLIIKGRDGVHYTTSIDK